MPEITLEGDVELQKAIAKNIKLDKNRLDVANLT
jgi:hypothetical protein